MKKIVILIISFIFFVGLSVLSFNFKENLFSNKANSNTDEKNNTDKKVSSGKEKNENTSEKESDKKTNPENIIIQNFKLTNSNKEVNIFWDNISNKNVTNFKLYKISSRVEGETATFNISENNGVYNDKKIKPGVRYYYEIGGKAGNGTVYSDMISIFVPCNIYINQGDSFYTINDEKKDYEKNKNIKSFSQNGRFMIPARAIINELGGTISVLSEKDKQNKSALIKFRNIEIEINSNKRDILVNRKLKSLDTPPLFRDGVFYIPDSLISEYFDSKVKSSDKNLVIEKNDDFEQKKSDDASFKQETEVSEGKEFTMTVVDAKNDGKKWYYYPSKNDAFDIVSRIYDTSDEASPKYIYTFKAKKKGNYVFKFNYFNFKLGISPNDPKQDFSIKVN